MFDSAYDLWLECGNAAFSTLTLNELIELDDLAFLFRRTEFHKAVLAEHKRVGLEFRDGDWYLVPPSA